MSHSQLAEALNKEPRSVVSGLCGVVARGHIHCVELILAKNPKAKTYRRENKGMGASTSGSV